MNKQRLFLAALLILTASGVGGAAVWRGQIEPAMTQPVEIDPPATVAVTRGAVTQTILAPGQTVATREAVVGSLTDGVLEAVLVRPGATVAADDPIARVSGQAAPIIAPFDGVVTEILARPGEGVGKNQPIAVIIDPSQLEVWVNVVEEDAPLVKVGQAATLFFDALPEEGAPARITRIAPSRVVGEARPLYRVYLSLERTPSALLAGMTTDAEITVAEVANVLRLPRGIARGARNGVAQVKVWTDGRIEERSVRLGLRGAGYVEILSGLAEGEQVVEG